mmetsp:Transcript_7753/g.11225  ORF Transcript_7753/g.11225 Transcript_7753/m.11225 type:complete len:110 (+) Transcript_7753:599-928(+)
MKQVAVVHFQSHTFCSNVSNLIYYSPPLEALGTAKIADCIGVEQIGHWGGPLEVWRLGFKHLPWNMCPQGLSWVSTFTVVHKAQVVEDGTSTEALIGSPTTPPPSDCCC